MNHSLFIAKQVVAQPRILFQRLSQPGDIPMSKDSQAPAEELMSRAVPLGELILKEGDGGLRGSHSSHCHKLMPDCGKWR